VKTDNLRTGAADIASASKPGKGLEFRVISGQAVRIPNSFPHIGPKKAAERPP
jgi:hypothetical protein